ncbi:hypothetical protein RRG08_044603 [Elysia crispata]|uniref:Uncharacterized protein n=1 Tax=Elysia crispata TaxID=231223 RepID=A0AAE1D161_9GAST|nr:hypothetical protein RRG08_044603 [Elysia crispata]
MACSKALRLLRRDPKPTDSLFLIRCAGNHRLDNISALLPGIPEAVHRLIHGGRVWSGRMTLHLSYTLNVNTCVECHRSSA